MKAPPEARLFTIGHSTHSLEVFHSLLRLHAITAVVDVRSSPFSRFTPHFNREPLATALNDANIQYLFLGQELGARRSEVECYVGRKARYDLIANTPLFRRGLDCVQCEMKSFRVALLCAEKDPLTCHRTILVCRHLRVDAGAIYHILDDGGLESHVDAETRLLKLCELSTEELFRSRAERIEEAYDLQGNRIAYIAPIDDRENPE